MRKKNSFYLYSLWRGIDFLRSREALMGENGRTRIVEKTNNFLDVLLKVYTEQRVIYVLPSTWVPLNVGVFFSSFLVQNITLHDVDLVKSHHGCSCVDGVVVDFFKITNGTGTEKPSVKLVVFNLCAIFFFLIFSSLKTKMVYFLIQRLLIYSMSNKFIYFCFFSLVNIMFRIPRGILICNHFRINYINYTYTGCNR